MVGVVAGNGAGLFNVTAGTQGDHGVAQKGNASQGIGGNGVHVNVSNGNLVVTTTDRQLSGAGADLVSQRTYNLFGQASADGDFWRGDDERCVLLVGTRNGTGSSVVRTAQDGHETVYRWNGSVYFSEEGGGAHDSLVWDATASEWVWTEGSTRQLERYDGSNGRLLGVKDIAGNEVRWVWGADGRLASMLDVQSGQELVYVYGSNGKLARLDTRNAAGGELTRQVHYSYDALNRLVKVQADLSPADGSVADGTAYTTAYTWHDSSHRLASISTNNILVQIEYLQVNGEYRVGSVTDGAGTNTFSYNDTLRTTTVINNSGQQWLYRCDASGRLVEITTPPVNGQLKTISYFWDAQGNLTRATDASGRVSRYSYDTNGNCTLEWDGLGNTVSRIYSAANQLQNETRYSESATLLNGVPQLPVPGNEFTSRNVFSSKNQLRYSVSAEGRVTEYRYNVLGQLTREIEYRGTLFSVVGMARTATLSEAELNAWVTALTTKAQSSQTVFTYDARGNLSAKTEYAKVSSTGAGVLDAATKITEFVYSDTGMLLQTIAVTGADRNQRAQLVSYLYDNAGRLLSEFDANGTRTHVYDSNARSHSITNSDGMTVTTVVDFRGRLKTRTEVAVDVPTRTTRYTYDSGDRLLMVQAADGARAYTFYDDLGRMVGQVNARGELTEFVLDDAGRQLQEVRYAQRLITSGWYNGTDVTKTVLAQIRPATTVDDRVITFGYDAAGRRASVTDAAGVIITNEFDAAGRVVATRTLDRLTRFFHDADGLLLAQLDAEGYLVRHEYNAGGLCTRTLRYATAVAVPLRADGTLTQLLAAVGTAAQASYFYYDAAGRKIGEVDEQQFVTSWIYDDANRTQQTVRYLSPYTAANLSTVYWSVLLASATIAGSEKQTSTIVFDVFGRVVSRTAPDGSITTMEYDAAGRLVREVSAAGSEEERISLLRYNAAGELVSRLWGEGAARILPGMTQAQVAAIHMQYGEQYRYDMAGNKAQMIDRGGNVTSYFYDAAGRLTFVVDANGGIRETGYNNFGEKRSTRTYRNALTETQRAGLSGGRISTELSALITGIRDADRDSIVSDSFNTRGLLAQHTDAEGFRTNYVYTSYGELYSQEREQAKNNFALDLFGYNARGERLSETRDSGGLNLSSSLQLDAFGRVIRRTDALGKVSTTAYTSSGRYVTETDPIGHTRARQFDALGRVLFEVDALGNRTSFAYDVLTRTFTVTTPEGISTATTSNRHGQEISVTDGNGGVTRLAYNRNGDLLTRIDAKGVTVLGNIYDSASGLLQSSSDAGGTVITVEYDALNRVFMRTNGATGAVTRYGFDAQGRQVTVTESFGNALARTTAYTHDRNGAVLTVTMDPDGLALRTTYTYDGEGRQSTVAKGSAADPAQQFTRFIYDDVGRISKEIRDPDGLNLVTENRYDAAGRLTRVIHPNGVSSWNVYDSGGLLRNTVNALGEVSSYAYDSNNRQVSVVRHVNRVDVSAFGDVIVAGQVGILVDAARDARSWTIRDRDGREIYRIDERRQVTELRYDGNGNVLRVIAHNQELPPEVVFWQNNFSAGLDGFANASLLNTYPDIFTHDLQNGRLTVTRAAGTAVSTSLYGRENAYEAGLGYSVDVTTGDTLPTSAMVGISNRLVTSGTPPSHRRLALSISNGNLCADMYTEAGGKTVVLGAADINTTYKVEFETRAGSTLMYVYRQGQTRAQGYVYELVSAGWNTVSFSVWGSRASDGDGASIHLDNLKELHRGPDAMDAQVLRRVYDSNNRLRYDIDPRGAVTERIYDPAGNLAEKRSYENVIANVGALNAVELNEADMAGRVAGSDFRAVRYMYDTAGRLSYQVDMLNNVASGRVTGFVHDVFGRVIEERAFQVLDTSFSNPGVNSITRAALDALWLVAADKRNSFHVYDAADRRRFTVNAMRQVIEQQFDALGRVALTSQFVSPVNTFITATTTPSAFSLEVYAANTAVGSRRDTRVIYDAAGRARFNIDAMGAVSEKCYDALGNVWLERIYAADAAINFGDYSEGAVAVAVAGRENRQTRHAHDTTGRLRFTLDAAKYLSETAYDALGRVVVQTRYGGAITDAALLNGTTPLDASAFSTVANAQSAAGNMRRTRYVYDARGDLRYTLDAAGYVTEGIRDANGRLLRETRHALPTGFTWLPNDAQVAQEIARLSALAGYSQRSTHFRYDEGGNAVLVVDAMGYVTWKSFDAFGAVVSETRYAEALTGALTDAETLAAVRQRTDFTATLASAARSTTYVNNKLGQLVEKRSAAASFVLADTVVTGSLVSRYIYNGFGELKELREGEIQTATQAITTAVRVTTYDYDALGRQRLRVLPGWYDASLQRVMAERGPNSANRQQIYEEAFYDGFGNLVRKCSMLPPTPWVSTLYIDTRYVYDASGRQRFEIDSLGYITETTYDAYGNPEISTRYAKVGVTADLPLRILESAMTKGVSGTRILLDAANDRTITTAYDALGRKTSVSQAQVSAWTYAGDETSNAGGGVAVVQGLDDAAVRGYAASLTTASVLAAPRVESVYNAFGDVIEERVAGAGSTWRQYDALGRETLSIDAGGYYTKREYFADTTQVWRLTEYAVPVSTAGLAAGNLPPPPATDPQGKNRVTKFAYDGLLRQVRAEQANVGYKYQLFEGSQFVSVVNVTGQTVTQNILEHNAWGEVEQSTDALGNISRVEYDSLGRTTRLIEPERQTATATGGVAAQKLGSPVTSFAYNAFGEVVTQTRKVATGQLGAQQIIRTSYDHAGNVISTEDATGGVTSFRVDALGRVLSEEQQITADYQDIGGWSDASATKKRTFTYDYLGRQLITADSFTSAPATTQSTVTRVVYNSFGEVTTKFLNECPTENFWYDKSGRLIRTLDAGGETLMDYDVAGRMTRSTQTGAAGAQDDRVTVNSYDVLGRLTQQRAPKFRASTEADAAAGTDILLLLAGITTPPLVIPLSTQVLDRWGNVISRTDARGAVSTFAFDHENRLVEEVLPESTATRENKSVVAGNLVRQYVRDAAGNVTNQIEFFRKTDNTLLSGRGRLSAYNAVGQLVAETDATGNRREYRVDGHGNRVYSRDGIGNWTYDVYDAANRSVEHGSVTGSTRVVDKKSYFDQAGNLYMEVFGSSAVNEDITLTSGNVLTEGGLFVTGQAGNTRLSRFDERGNVVKTRNESGVERTFVYDIDNRKASETDGNGKSLSWTYDIIDYGRMKTHTDLGGRVVTYAYNGFGQLLTETITNPGTSTAGVVFNNAAAAVTHYYTPNGLLWKSFSSETPVGSTVGVVTWTSQVFDANSNLVAEENIRLNGTTQTNISRQTVIHQLDAQGRLVKSVSPSGVASFYNSASASYTTIGLTSFSIEYDEYGNRRHVQAKTPGLADVDDWFSYDADNRVVVAEGFVNAAGKIVAGESAGVARGTRVTYDANGRRTTEERWNRDALVTQINSAATWSAYDQYKLNYFSYSADGFNTWIGEQDVFRANGTDSSATGVTGTITFQDADGLFYSRPHTQINQREYNTYDSRGNRLTRQTADVRGQFLSRHDYVYRGDGQLLRQRDYKTWTALDSQTVMGQSAIGFGTGIFFRDYMHDAAGNQVHYRYEKFKTDGTERDFTQTYDTNHVLFDDYKPLTILSNGAGPAAGLTDFTYNGKGHLLRVNVGDGLTRDFVNSRSGQIVTRMESGLSQSYIQRDGTALLNFGTLNATETAAHFTSATDGSARGGATRYTVSRSNETASSVALAVYGDALYWYLVADANGLAGNTELIAPGTTLTLPNVLANHFNNAGTVTPYSQTDATGNTTPSPVPPPPPKNKCAGLAQIVMIVVAVVATVFTAGAAAPSLGVAVGTTTTTWAAGMSTMSALASASITTGAFWSAAGAVALGSMVGSAASQLVGKAAGVVDHFSWSAVGRAGITSLLTAGIAGLANGVSHLNSAVRLEALARTGFNWTKVAAAAQAGAASYAGNYTASRLYGDNPSFNWQAFAGTAITSGIGAGLIGKYGNALKLNGAHWSQELARNSLVAGTSAHLEDKWFGGARPDYAAVANSVVAQFMGDMVKGGLTARYGGASSVTLAGASEEKAFGEDAADSVLADAAPDETRNLLDGPQYAFSNRAESHLGLGIDFTQEADFDVKEIDKWINSGAELPRYRTTLDGIGHAEVGGGDTLEKIAKRIDPVNWRAVQDSLAQRNNLSPDSVIHKGQVLAYDDLAMYSDADLVAANRRGGSFTAVDAAIRQERAEQQRQIALAATATAGSVGWHVVTSVAPDVEAPSILRSLTKSAFSGLDNLEIDPLVEWKDRTTAEVRDWGIRQGIKGNDVGMVLGGVVSVGLGVAIGTSLLDYIPGGRAISSSAKAFRNFGKVPANATRVDDGLRVVDDAIPNVKTLSYKPTSGVILQVQDGKTTTILGSFQNDMREVVTELGNIKNTDFGPKPGGFNVLNVPDDLYRNPKQFWTEYNQPWLSSAIGRGDNFLVATRPGFDVADVRTGFSVLARPNPITGKMELSGFGREYLMMKRAGYSYENGVMLK